MAEIKFEIDINFNDEFIDDDFAQDFEDTMCEEINREYKLVDTLMKEVLMRSLVFGVEHKLRANKEHSNVRTRYNYIIEKTDKHLSNVKRRMYEDIIKDLEEKGVKVW